VMWSMHEASIYDLPIPCMIDREWVGDEKINICAFSRTGVLSATFLHSLAGVHQNCSPAMHDLASVKLSESHACFLAASACSSHFHLSIQLQVACHDSFCIWIGGGVYLHTRFSRANEIRSDWQASFSKLHYSTVCMIQFFPLYFLSRSFIWF
jgi:hypothetical protein